MQAVGWPVRTGAILHTWPARSPVTRRSGRSHVDRPTSSSTGRDSISPRSRRCACGGSRSMAAPGCDGSVSRTIGSNERGPSFSVRIRTCPSRTAPATIMRVEADHRDHHRWSLSPGRVRRATRDRPRRTRKPRSEWLAHQSHVRGGHVRASRPSPPVPAGDNLCLRTRRKRATARGRHRRTGQRTRIRCAATQATLVMIR